MSEPEFLYFKHVDDQFVTDPDTEEVVKDRSGKVVKCRFRAFLLQLTNTPEFGLGPNPNAPLSGIEATEFQLDARRRIKEQDSSATGHYRVTVDEGAAFKRCVKKLPPQGELAEAFLQFMRSVMAMTSELPASAARPLPTEANGAAAQA